MQIVVAQVSKQGVRHQTVELPEGSLVSDALRVSGMHPAKEAMLAIHNVRTTQDAVLVDGDRVEILPALSVDPMTARRLREAKNQNVRRDLTLGRNGGKHRLIK
ncbi:MAG: RnfH family protein [Burkholderiaceae bacterium]|nr:RnfH family protein [Burkholderiaceae bacterium]